MKLATIHLHKFGHFDDARIELDTSRDLHVLFGPNEAGKSTIQNAIRYTLYGMPKGSSHEPAYTFRFDTKLIRTDLDLLLDDANLLRVGRRRGQAGKDILDAATGEQSADVARRLEQALHGVPRPTFDRLHGLNQKSMRAGAKALLDDDAADESVLAIASGMTRITQVRSKLLADLESLIKVGGRTGDIQKAIAEYNAAEKAHRAATKDDAAWEKATAEHERLEEAIGRLAERRIELDTERKQLTKAIDSLPLLARRDELVAARDAIEPAPATWTDREHEEFEDATKAASKLRSALATVTTQIESVEAAIAQLTVDDQLVAARPQLDELHARDALVKKESAELAEHREQLADATKAAVAAAIAVNADAATPEEALPSDAARTQLAAAIEARITLDGGRDTARTNHHKAVEALEEATSTADLEAPKASDVDVTALAAAIDGAKQFDQTKREKALTALREELAELERACARIDASAPTLEHALTVSLPADVEREQLERALGDSDAAIAHDEGEIANAEGKIAERREQITELATDTAMPEPAALQEVRSERAAVLAPIRAAVLSGEALEDAKRVVAAHDDAVEHADQIADRIAEAGATAGKIAVIQRDLDKDLARVERHTTALAERRAARVEIDAAWAALWEPTGFAPRSTETMQEVVREIKRVRGEHERVQKKLLDAEGEMREVERACADLAAALGIKLDDSSRTLASLLAQAETQRTAHQTWREQRAQADGAIKEAKNRVGVTERELNRAVAALDEHTPAWNEALEAAGLASTVDVAGAKAHLEAIDELRRLVADVREAGGRVERAEATIESFDADARQLLDTLEHTDANSDNPRLAVRALRERALEHEQAATKRRERQQQLQELREKYDDAMSEMRGVDERHAALRERADVADDAALDALDQRYRTRAAAEQVMNTADAEIMAACAMTADALASLVADRDEAALRIAVSELDDRVTDLDNEHTTAVGERDELGKRIGVLEQSQAKLEAGSRMRDAKARLEQLVPAYRQLALQLQLLDEFMARHGADVGPVVERTSEYFARLTCGEWDGVERVYGEGGTPEFFAVHSREPEQSFVALDDLSEGTRDQLFLALRLAYLVEHAHRGERIPFIADDILPSSDNERAAATMSLFADVSERFQVIVFTHHAHLTGIAEEAAGERVQTHDLPRFGAFVQAVEDAEVLA